MRKAITICILHVMGADAIDVRLYVWGDGCKSWTCFFLSLLLLLYTNADNNFKQKKKMRAI